MHLKQILSNNVRSETFSVNKSKTIKETRNFDWVWKSHLLWYSVVVVVVNVSNSSEEKNGRESVLQVVEELGNLTDHNFPFAVDRRLAFDLFKLKRIFFYFVTSRSEKCGGVLRGGRVRKNRKWLRKMADWKKGGVTCSATSPSGVKRNFE